MNQYNCVLFLVSAEAKPGHRHKGQGVQTPRHSPEAVGAALGDLPPGPPSEAHEGGGERLALCLTLGFSGGLCRRGCGSQGQEAWEEWSWGFCGRELLYVKRRLEGSLLFRLPEKEHGVCGKRFRSIK